MIPEHQPRVNPHDQQPETHITGPKERKIFTGIGSDIGFFSGKVKKRLELSNDKLDPTHKFAIALFDESVSTTDPNHKTDKKGVYVHLRKNEQGTLMTDVADISSIAKRLNLSEKDVRELATAPVNDQGYSLLDLKIQKIVDDYEKKVIEVKNFVKELKELSQKGQNLPEIQAKLKNFGNGITIQDNDQNKELKILLKNFCENNSSISNISDFKAKLKEFEARLSEIDKNFTPNIAPPPEKVTKDTKIWGNETLLFNCVAGNISNDKNYKPKAAVRLNLALDEDKDHRFAIKTDGYIYHEKPKSSETFIPYSKDGQTWVLLNINSLSDRLEVPVRGRGSRYIKLDSHGEIINVFKSDLKSAEQKNELEKFVEQKRAYLPGDHLTTFINELRVYIHEINLPPDRFKLTTKVGEESLFATQFSTMYYLKNLDKNQLFKLFSSDLDKYPELKRRFLLERGEEAIDLIWDSILENMDAARIYEAQENEVPKIYEAQINEAKTSLDYLINSGVSPDKFLFLVTEYPILYSDVLKNPNVNVNIFDSQGRSPLHIALLEFSKFTPVARDEFFIERHFDLIKALLEKGAIVKPELMENLLKENDLGVKLLNVAKKKNNAEVIQFLNENGVGNS